MSNDYFAGGRKQTYQRVVALGTGSVSTQTAAVAHVRRRGVVTGFRVYGQSAPTAGTLTAQLQKRTAGASAVSISNAVDIDFASGTAALAGVAGTLTASAVALAEDDLLEVVITAATATAGPGDLTVSVEYESR